MPSIVHDFLRISGEWALLAKIAMFWAISLLPSRGTVLATSDGKEMQLPGYARTKGCVAGELRRGYYLPEKRV
jgi:hypothetical protein